MRCLLIFWGIIYTFFSFAQPPNNRYVSPLFSTVSETTNVLFSSNVPIPNPGGGFYETLTGYPLNVDEFSLTNVNLYMNIFQPSGDTLSKRPVVIICFGGGFITGSKDHWSIRLIAQELAKRGFVTAVIDYRLGMNIFDEDLSVRAVYRGAQDGRSAVRFFKADAAGSNTFKIDPDHIYIGGHSAGAFVATHNAYLDKESERPASTYVWSQGCGFWDLSTCNCPDQGCLDCVGNNKTFNGQAKAVFSLAGAVGFTSYMESATDPKIVMFHSQDDDTVPYNSGQPFSSVSGWIVGFDLPDVYGSLPMSQRADVINLPDQFYSYNNRGHDVHEQTSSSLYNDIIPGISNWFYEELLKPIQHPIEGLKYVCESSLVQTYHTVSNNAAYYDWKITGGTFITQNTNSTEITVLWDLTEPIHQIKLTPYSIWDAKGEETLINISIAETFVNQWTGTNAAWENPQFWSLLMLPQSCHHVVFPSHPISPIQIQVSENQNYIIKSLNIGHNVNVLIPALSSIIVQN